MKTIFHKFFLSIAGTLIGGICTAQATDSNVVPFKDILRKQFSDNFTAREIKKKELGIVPSQIVSLNIVAGQPTKKEKNRKKKNSIL